ncbi:Hypothetical protein NAEGRDRAFT_80953 [Naegleria gruberi]|uniref:Uncharacterized protein n=1 Tax=Naegleria gruberi TaxID=5762 RepID=D2VR90_NAEGR|nr:uncharacterized protein NAEGRDRAFT_80953 [Naegleria gruberi]EFC40630.1 Hypothetical protein NAEGRDRAFT_80953 [Naegleria gruberi]|eukprot:XP_002673374.1 Hypothetical protein NAEGRDRAFT_80953 [Naegleria gruberi strain NEG-M]
MPNRKPIDFHNQVLFKQQHDKTSNLSSCILSYQILTNIDTSSLANTVIKKSNVLKFDINIKFMKNSKFSFQPNRYYCMIELRDPTNGTMLVTQDGNSLLSKETMCSLSKISEVEFGAQLKVSINKGNRGTKGIFRIQLLDRDDSSNGVEWTTIESFLIQDRNSKRTTTESKKRKCNDTDSEQHSDDACKSFSSSDEEAIHAILKTIHPNIVKQEEEEQTFVSPKKKNKLITVKKEFGDVENVHPNIVASMPSMMSMMAYSNNNTSFDYKLLQPTLDTTCNEKSATTSTCATSSANLDELSQLDFLFDFNNTLESTPEEGLVRDEFWCSDSLSSFFNNFD